MAADQTTEKHVTTVRLGERGLAWLEELRWDLRVPRADVIRACFAVARRHETEVRKWIEDHG